MKIRLLVKDKTFKDSDSGLGFYKHALEYYPATLQVSDIFDKETGEYVDWQDIEVHFESEDY